MRKLIYFALLVTVIPLFAACKKSISTGSQENFEHYIFFGHQVESKASLINGKEDVTSFGVVGFKYDNTTSWDEYKIKTECTPNVFFDENNSPVDVETLNCTKGSPSYTPLQGWSNTRRYTFFAFYPIGNENVDIVSANGSEYKGGVPAIKYSLNTEDLQGSMVDVMVSEPCKDLYYNSSEDNNLQGSEVKLKFNHILSALGVNFTKATENTIKINGVSMTISGIQYQTYIYPLDGVAAAPGGPAMDEKSFALSIPEGGVEVSSESTRTEIADKLIFIPQSGNATISLTINYTRSAGADSFTDKKSFIDIKTAFEAGKKHLIQLKFTDSTVEVDVTSGAWTDVEDVNNTFN
ncbi:MAG: fimbrillin family protein [Bacteroidales bacterium]|nr:fimbrillin family protein [Bacteroidales bacterium]